MMTYPKVTLNRNCEPRGAVALCALASPRQLFGAEQAVTRLQQLGPQLGPQLGIMTWVRLQESLHRRWQHSRYWYPGSDW